ncbi:hypothetical protein H072_77 [Dactylellina haptotyla CBS 200.50]|uniref:Mid2 domain-containing protein n=1 Tax=Dactylellina haptotyla (strain CBS 200.50) TaxID=1284197 RepID=S8AST3_DACHA|nr:hypothetical protein H072_77 [Dactylellina haptotyla CBS 200.50]
MCCGPGTGCLGNGICHSGTYVDGYWVNTYSRGSCTDQSWQDSVCIRECLDGGLAGAWGPLIPCIDDVDEYYCYYPEGDNSGNDCASRDDVFSVSGGNSVATIIGVPGPTTITRISTYTSTVRETRTIFSTITSTVVDESTVFVTLGPGGGSFSTLATSTRGPCGTGAASSPTGVSKSSTESKTTPGVMGAAVGASLGAVILSLSTYIAYLRKKRREAERMIPGQPMWQVGPSGPANPASIVPLPPTLPGFAMHSVPIPPPPPPPVAPPPRYQSGALTSLTRP